MLLKQHSHDQDVEEHENASCHCFDDFAADAASTDINGDVDYDGDDDDGDDDDDDGDDDGDDGDDYCGAMYSDMGGSPQQSSRYKRRPKAQPLPVSVRTCKAVANRKRRGTETQSNRKQDVTEHPL